MPGAATKSEMSDGASAQAGALQATMSPALAGERVAVLTVEEALSERDGPIPDYEQVHVIGDFSVEGDRYIESAAHRRYLRKPPPDRTEQDLNVGYENVSPRMPATETSHLLYWISRHKDKVVSPPSPDEERPSTALEAEKPRMVFVCGRFTLQTLICTPLAKDNDWLLGACRRPGIVYIYNLAAKSKEAGLPEGMQNWELHRPRHWGAQFRRIMTTKQPEGAGDDDEEPGETGAYIVVLRSKLASHSIVLAAQVKAVDPTVQCEPGSTAGLVEFKLTQSKRNSTSAKQQERQLMLAWWAQCRLAGISRAMCGVNKGSTLSRTKYMDVNKMLKMAKKNWKEDVCWRFSDCFLSFIKQLMTDEDGKTVYLFEYKSTSKEIVCSRLTAPEERYQPWGEIPDLSEGDESGPSS